MNLDPRRLEAIAARAWPAAREARIGGWRLYGSAGFSGRINACWPLEDPGRPLLAAITATEEWYAAAGLPCLFKIVDEACAPTSLKERLAALGYRRRTETLMMTASLTAIADPEVRLSREIDEEFAMVFAAAGPDPGDSRERLDALARVPAPRVYARLDVGCEPGAIGACAVEGEWVGIFAMRTHPGRRRRGLARRVLGALMAKASDGGARRAYLQVTAANEAALSLYRTTGFEEAYRYGYWGKMEGVA